MSKKFYFLCFAILGTAVFGATLIYIQFISQSNRFWGYNFDRFSVDEKVVQYEYADENERLSVTQTRNIDHISAIELIKERVFMFSALFEEQRVGYVGQHTQYVECDAQFKPLLQEADINGLKIAYFSGFANDRYVPGVCEDDAVSSRFIIALSYCNSDRSLLEIDYYRKLELSDPELILDRIKCLD